MSQETRYDVQVQRNLLIPLTDGSSLAADLYLPAAPGRYPALVSYYPYHKDDLIGSFFEHPRRYFAERGYACLLVDFRGLGNSDSTVWEAMDPREATDGAEMVEWAAQQPWCDGNVGMWGMSYGGITSFKTAAAQPPHLKAIAPIMGSLDIYHDFLYPGGCLNCLGAFGAWGSFMIAMNLMPPMYQDAAGRWYKLWRERLARCAPPYVFPWQDHPTHDEYWQSKVIPAERIQVPTFLIAGWRDIFPEAMVQAYERISAPRKLLVGPWMHSLPDVSPFAQVDYLDELLRWWDYWLKQRPNGVMDEPPVTLFVQGGEVWKHEREWPIARGKEQMLFFSTDRTLAEKPPRYEENAEYQADPTVGVMAGLWDPTAIGLGLPLDQNADDVRSLTYTSAPLPQALEITGSPQATLHVALEDGEDVNLVVKLSEVAPNGHSSLITTGWLKASHHSSHAQPTPLARGAVYEIHVPLWATSYQVPQGHRLRVSVSCADFPRIWPTPYNPTIRLFLGGARPSGISFPTIPPAVVPGPEVRSPEPTVNRTPLAVDFTPRWKIERDLANETVTVTTGERPILLTPSRDGRMELNHTAKASVSAGRPDAAKVEGETTVTLQTPSGNTIVVETRSWITLNGMVLSGRVSIDNRLVFERQWTR
jgi:putative CocE/NonD family hydrolase